MAIEVQRIPETILQDFARQEGLDIVVKERDPDIVRSLGAEPFYATFDPPVETKEYPDHPILRGISGNGLTPQAALIDLCRNLEGKYLVIGAYTPDRREFYAPKKLVAAPLEEER